MELNQIPLVLLAAGKSSRMGFPKGLLSYQEMPLLKYQLTNFFQHGGTETIIVMGSHLKEYQEKFPWIEAAINKQTKIYGGEVRVVINPEVERGQFSSIQLGLAQALKSDAPASFLSPIDTPSPSKDVWQALADAWEADIQAIVPHCKEGGGHPVLLSRQFIESLIALDLSQPHSRLDQQIKQLPADLRNEVTVSDQSIRLNINNM